MPSTNQEFIQFAHTLADSSASIIKPYFRALSSVGVKEDSSPVTVADREAELAMHHLITAKFPEHGIVGEECGAINVNAEYIWVLDPVDGTKNFITGQPIFGTLISLLQSGKPIIGIINQPILGERWLGVAGEPTRLNDMRCCVRTYADLSDSVMSTTSPHLFSGDKKLAFDNLEKRVKYSIYGSDCYAYGMLATGQLDLVVESGLKAHDVMALIPVIQGAGGIITNWQGEEIIFNGDATAEIDVIACGDKAIHAQALATLNSA